MAVDRIVLDDLGTARAKAIQTLQHAVVAVTMLASGWHELTRSEGPHPSRAIAVLELAAGAALFLAIAWERRRHRSGAHGRFGWIEIASGLLLVVEGLEKHHDGKWFHADYFSGLLFILLGLFDGPLSRLRSGRRFLEADDTRLFARIGKIRRFELAWSDIAQVRREARRVVLVDRSGGSRAVRLSRYRNGDEVRRWLDDHLARHGLAEELPAADS